MSKTQENHTKTAIFPRSRKCAISGKTKTVGKEVLDVHKTVDPGTAQDLRVVDKHLTLEQLAEQTGLSKSALGKYESDDYKDISPFAIATLAKVLRCVH